MRPIMHRVLLSLLCLIFSSPALAAPLTVVVSIAPQKYLVDRITGDSVPVTVLATSGSDPHSYEPSPSQMRACATASLYFTIGVPFEDAWLPRLKGAAPSLTLVSGIQGIKRLTYDDAARHASLNLEEPGASAQGQTSQREEKKHGEEAHDGRGHNEASHEGHGHDEHAEDPHVWLSPMLMRHMAGVMTKALCKADPASAPVFRANLAALESDIDAMDADIAGKFAAFPENKRVFLTFHPSWRYFSHNYSLTDFAIEVDGKEPGPKKMAALITTAKRHGIKVLIVEPQYPKTAATAIAREVGATVVTLDSLNENWPATMHSLTDALVEAFGQP